MKLLKTSQGQQQKTLRKWLVIAGILAVILCGLAFMVNGWATGYVQRRVVSELGRRFDADVTYASLQVSVFPRITASGRDLVLQKKDRPGFLVKIKSFEMGSGLARVLFKPRHVRQVQLNGLEIHVPRGGPKRPSEPRKKERAKGSPVIVDELLSDHTTLIIGPKQEGKDPMQFDIHRLLMHPVGLDRPADFHATLTNARPPGEIDVTGQFGPWRTDDPGSTTLAAKYSFTGANLGVFHGISGILSSEGKFGGVLERLEVNGETDTPNFTVSRSGHPVHLHTKFHALVDGTNGNTLLEPVEAHFLSSDVNANGGVVKAKGGGPGREVQLDVKVDNGRLEDMIRLATKADQPVLRGPLVFTTKFNLPPGEADIMDRLRLDGEFGTGPARFASPQLREKLQSLSRHGKGEPENPEAGSDVSTFKGRFRLRDGVLTLTNIAFQVEGAEVLLSGTYSLRTEALNFKGTLRLTATLSQMTTGVKSFFLKLVDPLFKKKKAGTVVPIKVTGTRSKPSFGLDIGAMIPGGG